jgi:hypothetical protein
LRKSPIKHHVHQHQRKTSEGKTTVHDYDRGHGKHPQNISDPRPRQSKQSSANFLVHINYANQASENFPVSASSYPEAIEYAMLMRTSITPPTTVEAIMK